MKRSVGYVHKSYPQKRLIIGIVDKVQYKRVWDFYSIINPINFIQMHLIKRKVDTFIDYGYQFNDFNMNKVDLLHFFNTVSYGRTPWISTYETILPRFFCAGSCHHGPNPSFSPLKDCTKIRKALEMISAKPCKCIIAYSECNANMQRELLREFPEYQEQILKKMLVIHPPQKALVSEYSDKNLGIDGTIRFIFVGTSFFQKGGVEIIETLKMLREEYEYDLELIIISSLNIDNYATKKSVNDINQVRKFILENNQWIKFFSRLEKYSEVLEWMKKSHIGLLPTYADTFGFSGLEFQAAGCPVISTNIRALPEINNNDNGWIIKIPKNYLGEAIYSTEEDRLIISKLIRKGIEQIVHQIFSDKKIILEKSNNAINQIKKNHSTQKYSEKMSEIYCKAIQ